MWSFVRLIVIIALAFTALQQTRAATMRTRAMASLVEQSALSNYVATVNTDDVEFFKPSLYIKFIPTQIRLATKVSTMNEAKIEPDTPPTPHSPCNEDPQQMWIQYPEEPHNTPPKEPDAIFPPPPKPKPEDNGEKDSNKDNVVC